MKGCHIHWISSLAAFLCLNLPAASRGMEAADTLEQAVISTARSPQAYTGLKRLDRDDLLTGTALLGTPDLIKVLQNLSGVASGMELMSGLYVRGGDGSDNLFLLDGVPLFQVSHLAGLFSSFNTDVIRSVDFYKSGFPSRFGGKLSSVVDVTTKDGSMEKFGGTFSIGLLDGRLALNGPIIRDKLSYDVAIRRSWLDAIMSPLLALDKSEDGAKTKGGYALFDSNVNITYIPGSNDKINFRFFAGTDNFKYSKITEEKLYGKEIYYTDEGNRIGLSWGNLAASASWKHVFSRRSSLSAILYYTRGYSDISDWQKSNNLQNDVLTTMTYTERASGSVDAAGFKGLFSFSSGHHNISTGAEYQSAWYMPSRSLEKTTGETVLNSDSGTIMYRTDEASVFVEDEMVYGPFSFTAGVRLDGYFSGDAVYIRPQPRVSTSFDITENIIAKASYELMSQYSHLLSSIYLDLPTNLWMPSTSVVKPSDSQQAAAGVFARISRNWHLDVGGYYRTVSNCLIYSGSGSIFPPVDMWEDGFVSGLARSYGAELEARYLSEKFLGSLAYTLSWSERKFDRLHDTWFRDRFDNRHKLTLSASYRITDNIDINATWNYHSGNRVTIPEHIVTLEGRGRKYLFSGPYNAKMPDYHRLDLSCNFHRKTKRGNESIWNISIYNAYCRMNPILMRVSFNPESEPVAIVYSLVPIIPSFSYTFKF